MLSSIRNKAVVSLVTLLILGTILGALHNRALQSGSSLVVCNAVSTLLMPFSAGVRYVVVAAQWTARAARPRGAILRENARLRRQVRALTSDNARLRELADENIVLREQLGLRRLIQMPTVAAEVISRNESAWFDTATINRGRRAGIDKGDAVVNHLGIVGQVIEADAFTSQVAAISDSNSSIGGMVQRSRSIGIVQGQGSDSVALTYLPKDADVRKSDIVVTSGMGGVVPKGFVIGRVVKVMRSATAGTTSALVKPSVRVDQLGPVLVVKSGRAE
jgi:rod shape-determining protein MreC